MKYTAHAKRLKTDTFLLPEPGAQSYGGAVGKALKWVEKETLLDPKLWAVFVEQFRIGDVDDADLGWRSEYWGKMMRGACFTYRCTFDEELYRTMEFTVKDILTTIDRYGRVSGYSVAREFHGWDMWGRKYVLLGLQYFLEICRDDALADRIVESMCRQADYIINKVGAGEVGKIDVTYTSEWWDGLNSSSILEPFVRLYNITGRREYLDFAKKIIDCGGMRGFNIFEAALEGKLCPYQYPVTKAYEMISCFEGVIEYYRVNGERKYLEMAVNFARLVRDSDITVIGSAGTTHELFDNSRARQFNPEFKGIMQETCVTVTWMKFCLQLLSLTGDSAFADMMEVSAYNALLGAVNYNRNPYQGEIFAFDSYSPLLNSTRGLAVGGYKPLLGGAMHWGCCVAIGACGTGLFPAAGVMKVNFEKGGVTAANSEKGGVAAANSEKCGGTSDVNRGECGVAVNFYTCGEAAVETPCGKTVLKIDTDYPFDGFVRIEILPEKEGKFKLMLRVPGWAEKYKIAVISNGTAVSTLCDENDGRLENGYLAIERTWRPGDSVTLDFEMKTTILRAAEVDPDADEKSRCHAALLRGPVVLGLDSATGRDVTKPVKFITEDGAGKYARARVKSVKREAGQAVGITLEIETEDGPIEVSDYASCGKTWGKNKPVTAWITTKE